MVTMLKSQDLSLSLVPSRYVKNKNKSGDVSLPTEVEEGLPLPLRTCVNQKRECGA